MGWSFSTHDTGRKAHIEYLTSKAHFSPSYTPLEHRVVGNNVWQLVRIESENRTFITLDLIAKDRNGGWGYKGLSEDMGPTALNCPLSLLDKASPPHPGSYAVAWRERVRAFHKAKDTKKKSLEAGLRLVYGAHEYRLVNPAGPRKGWNVTRCGDGRLFRMNARQLAEATPAT